MLDAAALWELRASEPAQAAAELAAAGADEILLTSRADPSRPEAALVRRVSRALSIPLQVEAEVASLEALAVLREAGAASAAISGVALRDPNLIASLARALGSESVTIAFAARREVGVGFRVVDRGGNRTEWDVLTWARVVEAQGGGGLILQSPDTSAGQPFDLELLAEVKAAVRIPVLARGCTREREDVFDALMIGNADGVVLKGPSGRAAAWIGELKRHLAEHGLPMRLA